MAYGALPPQARNLTYHDLLTGGTCHWRFLFQICFPDYSGQRTPYSFSLSLVLLINAGLWKELSSFASNLQGIQNNDSLH